MAGNGKGTAAADAFPMLEARHVDNLVEAVQALSRNIVQLLALGQKQLAAQRATEASSGRLTDAVTHLAGLLGSGSAPVVGGAYAKLPADDVTPGGRKKASTPAGGVVVTPIESATTTGDTTPTVKDRRKASR